MIIKALENWNYTPDFGHNKDQDLKDQTAYTFRILSGRDDLELRKEGKDVFPDSLVSVIANVKNPPILRDATGKDKISKVQDLSDRPELKGLYMELIIEYGKHSVLDEESGKL